MNRQLLEKLFDPGQIRQRRGDDGKTYEYIEGAAIVQRLNDAFESAWSFEVLEHRILDNEVVVLGKLLAGGVEKMQFGASQITRRTRDKSIISIGDDLKIAATDSLKKCATLLGIGLQLYFKKDTAPAQAVKPARPAAAAAPKTEQPVRSIRADVATVRAAIAATPPASVAESDRITAKQIAAITTLATARGWGQRGLRDHTMERYQRMPDQLTKDEAALLINRLQLQQQPVRA